MYNSYLFLRKLLPTVIFELKKSKLPLWGVCSALISWKIKNKAVKIPWTWIKISLHLVFTRHGGQSTWQSWSLSSGLIFLVLLLGWSSLCVLSAGVASADGFSLCFPRKVISQTGDTATQDRSASGKEGYS